MGKRGVNKLILVILFLNILILKSDHAIAACGDGYCQSAEDCSICSLDCGSCAEEKYNLIVQAPLNGDNVKKGPLLIKVRVLLGSRETSSAVVEASSPIFETIKLLPSQTEYGHYEGIAKINKIAEPGQYSITLTAEKKTAKDEQIVKINLNPVLNINLAAKIHEAFTKGERIYLIGQVTDFNGIGQENATLNASIYTPIKNILNKTLKLNNEGRFDDSYLISFIDPDGIWSVELNAEDEYGNSGNLKINTEIGFSVGLAYYTVDFLSPLEDAAYSRGGEVPISVYITDEGEPVINAEVSFSNPAGGIVYLTEVGEGIYSTAYRINNDDSLGKWNLGIEVLKEAGNFTKVGVNNIQLYIVSSDVNVNVLSPKEESAYNGMNLRFKILPVYKDGNRVIGGYVEAKLPYKTIVLKETAPGEYTGSYVLTKQDVGSNKIEFLVEDNIGNKGNRQISLFVEDAGFIKYTFLSLSNRIIKPYWALWIVIIVVIGYIFKDKIIIKAYLYMLARSKKRQDILKKVRQDLDYKMKDGSITKDEYTGLTRDYSSRLTKEYERQLVYNKKIEELQASIKSLVFGIYKKKTSNEDKFKKYANKALSQGFSKEEIRKEALRKGWPEFLVNKVIS